VNHYELFEIDPSASEEEVRRAYRRLKEIYAVDSPAVYGAYTLKELDDLMRSLESAYGVLLDAEKRKAYDAELGSNGEAAPRPVPAFAVETPEEPPPEAPPEEPIGPETVYTGQVLRKVRESRGLSLDAIATKSKIKASYLRYLEEESWDLLPASVYVRGFLSNYARELKVDPKRVVETYFPRLKEYYDARKRE
jgi:flagellar biosynthesis protein FlhG